MAKPKSEDNPKHIVAQNRKARHDYHFIETYQVGVVLQGTEVKSLRQGKANLQDSYASIQNGEIFLFDCHISPYEQGNIFNHIAKRRRKLLMHKSEIVRLFGKIQQKGYTLVPLRIYFTRGKTKLDIALAQGKKQYDKREDIKRRDLDREAKRAQLR